MTTETTIENPGTPDREADPPFRLEKVETYRQAPIFHLVYDHPTVLDRAAHEREVRALAARREERFGLIVCFRNISFAQDYGMEAQAQVYHSPDMAELRRKAVAMARYNPGSLVSLIRTMSAHIYARHGMSADFVPDFDMALRAVRRGIDRALAPPA